MNVLSSNLHENGMYLIPTTEPGANMKAQEELGKKMDGKPYATVTYINSFSNSMTMPIVRGFIVDLVLVILLISILVRGGLPSFFGIFTGSLAVALFAFLWRV